MILLAFLSMRALRVWTQSASPGGVSTGLALWLKADAGLTLTGSSVDQWADQSPNAFSFGDSDGNAGPDRVLGTGGGLFNFNPYLDFSGGGIRTLRHTTAATTITTTQQSLVAVFNKRVDGQAMLWMDAGTNDGGMDMNVFRTGGNTSTWRYIPPSAQVPLNETHIVGGGDDVPGNATIDSLYDGRLVTDSTATASAATTLTAGHVYIGRSTTSVPYTGNAPEFIVYTRKLTPVEFQRVSSYLAIKYGVTMDQTSPLNYLASDASVIWDATTNATYNRNITGIGRDDASNLNQKQSRSANGANNGNLLTIGLGTIAADNASNANTFAADRNFLIWGDDGATALLKATFWRKVAIARALLARGADVHAIDQRGWNALGVAMLIEHDELTTLLRHHARGEMAD